MYTKMENENDKKYYRIQIRIVIWGGTNTIINPSTTSPHIASTGWLWQRLIPHIPLSTSLDAAWAGRWEPRGWEDGGGGASVFSSRWSWSNCQATGVEPTRLVKFKRWWVVLRWEASVAAQRQPDMEPAHGSRVANGAFIQIHASSSLCASILVVSVSLGCRWWQLQRALISID